MYMLYHFSWPAYYHESLTTYISGFDADRIKSAIPDLAHNALPEGIGTKAISPEINTVVEREQDTLN